MALPWLWHGFAIKPRKRKNNSREPTFMIRLPSFSKASFHKKKAPQGRSELSSLPSKSFA
jgi:hypothetical protein